ncbi:cation-translocating P-type ATPase [Candidatus Nomurabacteria bacterium]|nr:cation-translocating P-type ATPase [Candidatus Nomurabacteria bacterium]
MADTMKMKFIVMGMHCASCAASVERAVKKLDGVTGVYVNIATKTMSLDADEKKISKDEIIQTVKDNGYDAKFLPEQNRQLPQDEEAGWFYFLRFLTALIFSLLLFYVAMYGMLKLPFFDISPLANALLQILLLTPILIIFGELSPKTIAERCVVWWQQK